MKKEKQQFTDMYILPCKKTSAVKEGVLRLMLNCAHGPGRTSLLRHPGLMELEHTWGAYTDDFCQKSHRSCEREKSQKQDKDHRDYQSFVKDITKSKFWKHIQNTANHTCSNLKTLCPVLSLILTIWLQQTEKPKPYLNNSLQPHGTLIAS